MTIATGRLDLRLDPETKHHLAKAAELRGMPVAAFVRSAALREARQVLVEHETITLSSQEGRRLLEALNQPFKPNARLRRALARGEKLGL